MRKVKFGGKLFFRYLFSYLTLVLIPVVVIGIFYSLSFYRAFNDEVFLSLDKDVQNMAIRLEGELSTFSNMVKQITVSTPIDSASRQFDPEKINYIKQTLSSYDAINPFVSDLYLALPNIGYVLSSTTSCQMDYSLQALFTMDGVSSAEMRDFFAGKGNTSVRSGDLYQFAFPANPVLLVRYPVYTDYPQQIGTMVFQVPHSSIQNLVSDKLAIYNAETFIFDSNLTLITAVDATESTQQQIAGLTKENLESVLDALSDDYIVRSHHSSASGLHYLILVPRQQASFQQITQLNYAFLLSMLLVIAISGIAIVLALKLNYSPLSRLHNKAEQMVAGASVQPNELSVIETALETLSDQNLTLTAKLMDTAGYIKTSRLQKLITNGYPTIEDFNLDCEELNMSLGSDQLFVTASYIHSNYSADAVGLLFKHQFISLLPESYYIAGVETAKLIMIHSLSPAATQRDRQLLVEDFTRLHQQLQQQHGLLITTGIGSVVTGTTNLSQSYLESSTALDYRFIKGKGQVIDYSELCTGGNGPPYPQQLFDKLHNALLAANDNAVDQCIDQIIQLVEQNNYPLFAARGICFNLITLVTNTPPHSALHPSTLPPNLFVLTQVETIQDIVAILKNWRSGLGHAAASSGKATGALTIDQVLRYLEENCLDCNFSIYETASHFDMPLPKFSQYFKEHTNQNVLDFTIQLRMNEAARLLEQTDCDIKDIAQQTGYYNASSFIRRFKQIHGVTPGDYRKYIIKKQKGDEPGGK